MFVLPAQMSAPVLNSGSLKPLTGDLVRFFSDCGVMKAAVEVAVEAGK
jgi:hypothetical protein